jgi:hypothetical protein
MGFQISIVGFKVCVFGFGVLFFWGLAFKM